MELNKETKRCIILNIKSYAKNRGVIIKCIHNPNWTWDVYIKLDDKFKPLFFIDNNCMVFRTMNYNYCLSLPEHMQDFIHDCQISDNSSLWV